MGYRLADGFGGVKTNPYPNLTQRQGRHHFRPCRNPDQHFTSATSLSDNCARPTSARDDGLLAEGAINEERPMTLPSLRPFLMLGQDGAG